ncbi:hypothetical protein [Nonomuraea jabiensis]|uniref:hypothetical protein n=1 Tax=Nonomuraea jabiensis TaxID=882448 RepID=UPI003D735CA1
MRLRAAAEVAKVLAVICSRDRLRDRVLFETAYVCGARASEAAGYTAGRSWRESLTSRGDDR